GPGAPQGRLKAAQAGPQGRAGLGSSPATERLLMTLRLAAAAAAATLAAGAAQAQQADAAFHAPTFHLSASAEVRINPHMARLNLGVMTEAPTATGAMAANTSQMNAVLAAVRAAGVKSEDIQTAGVNLNPQYRYEQNQPPQLTGYRAENTVTVSVRDLP